MFYGNSYGEFSQEEQDLISSVEPPRQVQRGRPEVQAPVHSGDAVSYWFVFFLMLVLSASIGGFVSVFHDNASTVSRPSQNTSAPASESARPTQQTRVVETPPARPFVAPPAPSASQDQAAPGDVRPPQVQDYLPPAWSSAVFVTDVHLWVREGGQWRYAKTLPKGTEALVLDTEIELAGVWDGWHAVVGKRGEFSGYARLGQPLVTIPETTSWPLPPGWRRALFQGTREAVLYPVDGNWAFMISADGLTWGYARSTDFQPIPPGG